MPRASAWWTGRTRCFRIFGPAEREGLESARTFRYALLKPEQGARAHTLASYDDGAPALMEARGRPGARAALHQLGLALLDGLAHPRLFLPVLQQAVSWLAGRAGAAAAGAGGGGRRNARWSAPGGSRVETVLRAGGKPVPLRRENGAPTTQPSPWPSPDNTGRWWPRTASSRARSRVNSFVADLDPRRAICAGWTRASSRRSWAAQPRRRWRPRPPRRAGSSGTPLWSALLLLGALALLGEGALTRR